MRYLLAILLGLVFPAFAEGLQVKSGDRIAFLGDSITHFGDYPAGYINLVLSGLKANGITVVKIPAGVSGNKSNQMLARLQSDVLDQHPTWMTLSCGVNDVWHQHKKPPQGVKLEDFQKNITAIVEQAQSAGVQVVIMTATMIMENPADQRNQELIPYNGFLRKLATEKHCLLADEGAAMRAEIDALHQAYPFWSKNFLTKDGVHMNPLGDRLMALTLLKALGLSEEQFKRAQAAIDAVKVETGIYLPLGEVLQMSRQAYEQKLSPGAFIGSKVTQ